MHACLHTHSYLCLCVYACFSNLRRRSTQKRRWGYLSHATRLTEQSHAISPQFPSPHSRKKEEYDEPFNNVDRGRVGCATVGVVILSKCVFLNPQSNNAKICADIYIYIHMYIYKASIQRCMVDTHICSCCHLQQTMPSVSWQVN